jgi:hypothetical protein
MSDILSGEYYAIYLLPLLLVVSLLRCCSCIGAVPYGAVRYLRC